MQHEAMRQVRHRAHALPFRCANLGPNVGTGIAAAQLVPERIGEGDADGAPDHVRPSVVYIASILPAQFDQGQALARKVARKMDQFAPLLAPFPVAVYAAVWTKAEEERQRTHHCTANQDLAGAPLITRADSPSGSVSTATGRNAIPASAPSSPARC